MAQGERAEQQTARHSAAACAPQHESVVLEGEDDERVTLDELVAAADRHEGGVADSGLAA